MHNNIRNLIIAFTALICMAAPVHAVPDVDSALVEWKEAVESAELDAIMALYDRKAVMISSFAQKPMNRRSEIEDYYKKVVVNPDIHVEIVDTNPRRYGDMAINSGLYTLSYTQEGEEISLPSRFSFTYVLKRGKWIIVDHHSSHMPLAEEKE